MNKQKNRHNTEILKKLSEKATINFSKISKGGAANEINCFPPRFYFYLKFIE